MKTGSPDMGAGLAADGLSAKPSVLGALAHRLAPIGNTEPARSLALLLGGLALILGWLAISPAPRPLPVKLVLDIDPPGHGPSDDGAHGADHHDDHHDDHGSKAHHGSAHEAKDNDAARDEHRARGDHKAEESHGTQSHGHDGHTEKSHGPAGPPPTKDPMAQLALSDGALEPAPDLGLIEEGAGGFLPRIGADGRRPDRIYARPFADPSGRPRIGIVIRDFGLGQTASNEALSALPPEISLALSPYAGQPQLWTNRARAMGHEVLLELPMEPRAFPEHDPGPYALLTRLAPPERLVRLHRLLWSTTGYAGVLTRMGAAFLSSPEDLRPVLSDIAKRGLFFLEDGTAERSLAGKIAPSLKLNHGRADRTLDGQPSRRNVDLSLLELEAVARAKGTAIGVGAALPVTLARIKAWAPTLDAKGLVLAPVSAMIMPLKKREGVQHAALTKP